MPDPASPPPASSVARAAAAADTAPSHRRARRRLLDTPLRIIGLCRVSLIASLLAVAMIKVPSQALEALQVLLEDLFQAREASVERRLIALWRLLAIFAFTALAGLMSWAFARLMLSSRFPRALAAGAGYRRFALHYPRCLGVLPMLGLALAFFSLSAQSLRGSTAFLIALSAGVAAMLTAAFLYIAFILRLHVIRWLRRRLDPKASPAVFVAGPPDAPAFASASATRTAEPSGVRARLASRLAEVEAARIHPAPADPRRIIARLPRLTSGLLTLAGSLSICCLFLFWLHPAAGDWFGPMALVPLALCSWIPFASLLALIGSYFRFPALTALLILAVVFSWADLNDDHFLRVAPALQNAAPLAPALPLDAAFNAWLASRPDAALWNDKHEPYPVFVVATEGGGIRAGYLTARILARLQDDSPAFRDHLFMISAVSGGSVGSSVFTALLADTPRGQRPPNSDSFADAADKVLTTDLLAPLLAKFLYPDVFQQFLPFPIPSFDRARALEDTLADSYRAATGNDTMRRGFYHLLENSNNQSLPLLFLNTTNVGSGRRTVFAPTLSEPASQLQFTTFRELFTGDEPTLATAACLSARFPIVTPAGSLATQDPQQHERGKLRFVDGGYAENSGSATLLDALVPIMHPGSSRTPRTDISLHVIVISTFDDYSVDLSNPQNSIAAPDRTAFQARGLGEMLSPIRAMLNTRGGRGRAAMEDLASFSRRLGNDPPLLRFGLVTNDKLIPLGWVLSQASRTEIQRQTGADDSFDLPDPLPNVENRGQVMNLLAPPR